MYRKPSKEESFVAETQAQEEYIPGTQKDMAQLPTKEEVLDQGGCVFRGEDMKLNGQSWHPKIMPYGEDKCISCKCKVRL